MAKSTLLTIARFESKTLMRSWFFRIFSFIALLFIFFFNLMGYTNLGGGGWSGRLIPGSAPYMNLFILNIAQSIIAVFLSSDFLGRDKKLDTTEVFYVRSMSNTTYVFGKMLGILKVFFYLNLIVLLIGFIFNLIGDDIRLIPITYLLYPILISLPSLLFVLGLSFFLMVLVRNQAITFVLMLGLLGGSLFYFGPKTGGLLDFLAFYTPLAYSEFVGFVSFSQLFFLRLAFCLIGLGFIFFTIYRLPRLYQERYFKIRTLTLIIVLFVTAAGFFTKHGLDFISMNKMADSINKLDMSLPINPQFEITDNQLDVNHDGNDLAIISKMKIKMLEKTKSLQFLINPGFKVTSVKVENENVSFKQNLHSIVIEQSEKNESDSFFVQIEYQGQPDYRANYIDIDQEARTSINRLDPLVGGKRISFVKNDFILLTRESLWYPVAGWKEFRSQPQFTLFQLNYKSANEQEVISQGKRTISNKAISFSNDLPLNALSIVGGSYIKKTITADSVEISYLYHENNGDVLQYFDSIADRIPSLVTDIKGQFERNLGIKYPYKRLSLIEVPLHFYTFSRSWTLTTDDNMPEMIFIPERGAGSRQMDLKMQQNRSNRWGNQNDEEQSEADKQEQLFKNVIGNLLITPRGFGFMGSGGVRQISGWGKQMIFPQYFSFTNVISQPGFPVIQFVTENYLFSKVKGQAGGFFGRGGGGGNDQVILKMKGKNLQTVIDSLQNEENFTDFISMKGNQFFNTIEMGLQSSVELEPVLNSLLNENRFKVVSTDSFINQFSAVANTDFKKAIDDWSTNSKLPAYIFGEPEAYEIKDGNRTRFFISIPVKNDGACDGIVTIGIRDQTRGNRRGGPQGGGFRGGAPSASVEETYSIKMGEVSEIGIISENEPRELIVETYVSENIPTNQRLSIGDISKNSVAFFEGIRKYNGNLKFEEEYELIVDNEDEGFSVSNVEQGSTLKDWWTGQNEGDDDMYSEISFWNPSPKWLATLGSDYFGRYIKSVHYKQGGNGNSTAKWQAYLSQSSNYKVYTYISSVRMPRRGREDVSGTYLYTVSHDDGDEIIEVEPPNRGGEWIYLGEFYFSEGDATVSLSDKTEQPLVIADAIKWVKAQ